MTESTGPRRARKQGEPSQGVQPLPESAVAGAPTKTGFAIPGLARGGAGSATAGSGDAAPGPEDSLDNYKNPLWKRPTQGLWQKKTIAGKFQTGSTESKRDGVKAIKAKEQADHEKAVADAVANKKTPPKQKTIAHQPVADLGEIYAHTSMLKEEYEHQVEHIAMRSNGTTQFRTGEGMKSIGRALEKIVADYKGDESRLVDVTGGSVFYDSPEDLILGFQAIQENDFLKLARVKNTLKEADGYGDINLAIEVGGGDYDMEGPDGTIKHEHWDGFIIELQLHLSPIIKIKETAHKQYEEQRAIAAKHSKKAPKDWPKKDREKHDALGAEMKAMYSKGWDKCINPDDLLDPTMVDKLAPLKAKLAKAIPER